MFIRKKKNASGSISVQILEKVGRRNKLIKSVGTSKDKHEIKALYDQAYNLIPFYTKQARLNLYPEKSNDNNIIDSFVKSISTNGIICIGPELILGKIFDYMGFKDILDDELFRHFTPWVP